MASSTARPKLPTQIHSKDGSSLAQLQEFFLSACATYEPSEDETKRETPITLDVAPPRVEEEFSHEHAFGFAFADEMKVVRELRQRCTQGEALFLRIYFTRSCANCLPPPPQVTAEDEDVAPILRYYGGVYKVLRLQVAKLSSLCDFCSQTVGVLCDTIQRIAAQENTHRVVPDVIMDSILEVFDLLLRINHLYDVKGGLRNDFSIFRRAFKHVQGDIADLDTVAKENQRLHEFIGASAQAKNGIWESLRHNLTSIKRFEPVVVLLLKYCFAQLELMERLPPAKRFQLIRVLPPLVSVLQPDPVRNTPQTLTSTVKKLMEMGLAIGDRYPAVPILADLSINPLILLSEPNSRTQSDTATVERHVQESYDLLRIVKRVRNGCAEFTPRFMCIVNSVAKASTDGNSNGPSLSSIAEVVWEGLRLLFDWKSSLQLALAMKFQRPKTNDELEHMGVPLDHPFVAYKGVVTHNLSSAECQALVELIHKIKSLAALISKHKAYLEPRIRMFVTSQIQTFVQHTLVPLLHRADKKKHSSVKMLQDIRLTCGSWVQDHVPVDDYKKRRRERQLPDLTKTKLVVPPTLSQLQMLRTVVNAVYAKRSSGEPESKLSVFNFHRELKSSDVDALHRFYTESASYHILLDLDPTTQQLGSLEDLLFREIFLEVMKSPHLPIEDSLPWLILEQTIADAQNTLNVAMIFSVLDVYNDAIGCSLLGAGQKSVCDELAAEAKLFFDHFMYLLADHLYTSAKSDAARARIGQAKLAQLQQGSKRQTNAVAVTERNIKLVSRLRRIPIVDDTCDVSVLIGRHLIDRITRDLRSTVGKMTRHDATIFVAIVDLMVVMRATHQQLSEWFTLDDFDSMWHEASSIGREDSSGGELSRLQQVVSASIAHDLVVNFGYNERTQRFFRTPLAIELQSLVARRRSVDAYAVALSKDSATTASRKLLDGTSLDRDCRVGLDILHQPYRSFVGVPHIEAIAALASRAEVVAIADDVIELIITQIEDVMHLFVPVLGSAIPPYRLPKLLYQTEGCFGYFHSKFKHMMDSSELEAHVFHCLRVIGNGLAVLVMLSQVASSKAVDTERADASSLFGIALQRLYRFLEDTQLSKQWAADVDSNPERGDKNASTFYLVWVALEYLSCCPTRGEGATSTYREVYGEGIHLAGSTLIHLLGQRALYDQWNPSQYVVDVYDHDTVKQSATAAVLQPTRGRKNSGASASPQVGALDSMIVDGARGFVKHATQMRVTMKHFFALLEGTWVPPAQVHRRVEFSPPV